MSSGTCSARTRLRASTRSTRDRLGRLSRALLAAVSVALLTGLPHAAAACAVCSAGRDDATRLAFILTTVFLTVLPLAMVGGIVYWLHSRTRALEREATPCGREIEVAPAPVGALRA